MDAPYSVPPEKVAFYRAHGWVVLEDVVPAAELARINAVLDRILDGSIATGKHRSDLGGHADRVVADRENIVQVAWPTDLTSLLDENLLIQRSRAIVNFMIDQLGDPPKLG